MGNFGEAMNQSRCKAQGIPYDAAALRQIAAHVDAWEAAAPDAAELRQELESGLAGAIRSSPYFGKLLAIGDQILWVDERTADGEVSWQYPIELDGMI